METTPLARNRPDARDRAARRPSNRTDDTGPERRSPPRLRGRFTRDPDTAARDEHARQLHSDGMPYPEVAAVLGYSSAADATRAATRARLDLCRALTITTRADELATLERLEQEALRVVHADHVRMRRGRPVLTAPDDPTSTVPDWRPKLRAIDLCLRIMDRKAKLLGLYSTHPGPRIGVRR